MKVILKKVISILIIFIISTVLIYVMATVNRFFYWCNQNQIILFNTSISDDYILNSADKNKINELGENIRNYAELLEDSKENKNLEGDNSFYLVQNGENYAISEIFNPIGYSVWSYMQSGLSSIFSLYIEYSIFAGLAISIAYTIITSKGINNILKFAFGYFGVILIIPQLYFFSIAHSFGGLDVYKVWSVKFYIAYTVIFIITFIINYVISSSITKKLNKAFDKNK